LLRLLQLLNDAAPSTAASAGAAGLASDHSGPASTAASSGVPSIALAGQINSREDAARLLEQVCEWFDRHEPSHPAPLLVRRARRLMSKSFLEIVRDLAPDGLSQVERLAGPDAQ
jgi:type VI secretion system protein ImpA